MILSPLSLPRKSSVHPFHCKVYLTLRPFSMSNFLALLPSPPPASSSSVREQGSRQTRVKLPLIMPHDEQIVLHTQAMSTFLPLLALPEASSLQASPHRPISMSIGFTNERHDDSMLPTRLLDTINDIEPRPFVAKPDDHISLNMIEEPIIDKFQSLLIARQAVDPSQARLYDLLASESEDSLTSIASLGHDPTNDIWNMTASKTLRWQQSLPATLRRVNDDLSTGSIKNKPPSTTHNNFRSPCRAGEAEPAQMAAGMGEGTSLLSLNECTGSRFESSPHKVKVPLRIKLRKASKQTRNFVPGPPRTRRYRIKVEA